jgi:predicted N-acetyltransferase YhbS
VSYESLALGPVSVHKNFQNQGIGKQLINTGINIAKELGYQSIIVLGNYNYYSKFGFEKASKWHIGLDGDFNRNDLFAMELVDSDLNDINGNVEYCPEFYSAEGELI